MDSRKTSRGSIVNRHGSDGSGESAASSSRRRIFPEQFVMDFDAGKRRIQIGCKIRLSAEGQHRDIVRNRQPLLPHRPERRNTAIIEAQKTAVNSGFFRPISSDNAR